jgi:hypothetical protein
MTHIEVLDQFVKQNLKEKDLVKIKLEDGKEITGILSSGKVHCDVDEHKLVTNSRIGLQPPPPPPGKIYPMTIQTIYSNNIIEITKI